MTQQLTFKNVQTIENVNINMTVSTLRRSRSNESISSTSTVSDSGVKRRKLLNYLGGEGVAEWTPTTRLVLGDVDATSFFKRYRRKNLKLAESTNDLSCMKILSLSHIFPVNKIEDEKCISKHFDDNIKTLMHDYMYREAVLPRVSVEAVMFCKSISDRETGEFEPTDELNKKVKACCTQLKNACTYQVQENSETSYMQKFVLPYLNEVLMVNPIKHSICAMVDGVESSGRIPDWKLGYKKGKKGRAVFVFFVEVKRPGQTSKYQPEDDYVKLLKEMKDSLDSQIDMGLTSPFSFGLLVEGFRCSLHLMKVEGDGLYMPILVRKFSLMEELEDALNIPALVESLMFVKEKIAGINTMMKKRDKRSPLKGYTKPSFNTVFV